MSFTARYFKALASIVLLPTISLAQVIHIAPNGQKEMAEVLTPFPFVAPDVQLDDEEYSTSETWYQKKDAKKIKELADIDFYAEQGENAVGIAPKLHNTSAGFELYKLKNKTTKADIPKKVFETDPAWAGFGSDAGPYSNSRNAKKIAKYKPSVDYSQSESALIGYHLSILLGNVGFVPAVTYRTMTTQTMGAKTDQALQFLDAGERRGIKLNKWMRESWTSLKRMLKGSSSTIVSGDAKMAWGAIAQNPSDEADFRLFNKDYASSDFYKALQSSESISKSFSGLSKPKNSVEFKKAYQQLAYARDFSSAMIFDEIMRQVDRFGNFSRIERAHSIDPNGRLDTSSDPAAGLVLTRMLIKDNDDGLMSKGDPKIHAILSRIKHFDPIVYSRLQWLSGLLKDSQKEPVVKAYFLQKVHLREKNYLKIKETLIQTAESLAAIQNKLLLDLNLESHLKNANP